MFLIVIDPAVVYAQRVKILWAPVSLLFAVAVSAAHAHSPNIEVLSESRISPVTGSHPMDLVLAPDGTFYGVTREGGDHGAGIFFNVTTSGALKQINSFGPPNGMAPPEFTHLVPGADGNFYTVIATGQTVGSAYAAYPNGALVRITRAGVSSVVADFTGTGASYPISLIAASDGNLYGGTRDADAKKGGGFFRATTGGAITLLARLPDPNSTSSFVEGPDASFYGITNGKIVRVTKAGEVSIFHVFDPAVEGDSATGLFVGTDGKFYGGASGGAANGTGSSLFRIDSTGTVTVLARYNLVTFPFLMTPDGEFYATRTSGGGRLEPSLDVYRLRIDGSATFLHSYYPAFGVHLIAGPGGNLYGVEAYSDYVFRLNPAGVSSVIYSFAASDFPAEDLVRAADGNLYGTTSNGGSHNLGEIYRIGLDGTRTDIAEFNGLNGRNPYTQLTAGPDGNLYGAAAGGLDGHGIIYRVTTAGEITSLASLTEATAGGVVGSLAIGADNSLYGLTSDQVFKLSLGGSGTTLVNFSSKSYSNPHTGVTFGADGKLYGMATRVEAGPNNPFTAAYVVYSLTSDGLISPVYSFGREEFPAFSNLVADTGGNLYGSTYFGLFRLSINGQFTRLTSFFGGLTLGSDNNIYASTGSFAPLGGRLVRVTPDGIATTVATFDYPDGYPHRAIEGPDHRFYGTTTRASSDQGEIYRASVIAPRITAVTTASTSQAVIEGSSFTGATRVSFSGIAATSYSVDSDTQITATLPGGAQATAVSVTTPAGIATYPAGSVPAGLALNISTRGGVGTGNDVLIGGFIVHGSARKKVIVRALGPSLAAAHVAGTLMDPILELHDGAGNVVETNDDWQTSPGKQAIIDTGIPPTDSHESAIVRTLDPGNYTAVIRGANDGTGVALVEVYDLDKASGKLANISTRGRVQPGDNVLIGGFIVGGDAPGKVLVRALGPSLSKANPPVNGAMADPQLELRDSDGNLMASNDNWQDGLQALQISDTTLAPSDAKESAIVASLNPGSYTAIVHGANNTSGIGLVEVYKLD
ncbi:MAG: hypothetical protein QOD12_2395 [Verrucomicrobiota bacterium]|jgi:uncharacterized repeat protein (TIGR03803 family)